MVDGQEDPILEHVRAGKYKRVMKHLLKQMPKKMSAKEQAKLDKVNVGMEKIYALVERGLQDG